MFEQPLKSIVAVFKKTPQRTMVNKLLQVVGFFQVFGRNGSLFDPVVQKLPDGQIKGVVGRFGLFFRVVCLGNWGIGGQMEVIYVITGCSGH